MYKFQQWKEEFRWRKSQLGKDGMEQLSKLAIESELYCANDAIKRIYISDLGETKKAREWTLKRIKKKVTRAALVVSKGL